MLQFIIVVIYLLACHYTVKMAVKLLSHDYKTQYTSCSQNTPCDDTSTSSDDTESLCEFYSEKLSDEDADTSSDNEYASV